jgi:uncharacterized protein (DUF2141 family)
MAGKVRIINNKVEFIFKYIPFGEYVVGAYHDENSNGKYDWSIFGKSEAYGNSNGIRGKYGRPNYEKSAFILDKANMTIRITVK